MLQAPWRWKQADLTSIDPISCLLSLSHSPSQRCLYGLPMNSGEALLHAILANPDQDTLRLVLADWLDENGEAERAAFIRFQIELALLQSASTERATRNFLRRVASVRRLEAFKIAAGKWAASGFEIEGTPMTSRGVQHFYGDTSSGSFFAKWSRGFVGDLELFQRLGHVVQSLVRQNPVTRVEWYPMGLDGLRFPRFEVPGHVRRFVIHLQGWRRGAFALVGADKARRFTDRVSTTAKTSMVVRLNFAEFDGEATEVFESAYPDVRILRQGDEGW
jgi:uncharacterized protein (TIGR02996 family)